ncbi:hypothetical protein [Gossypium barbadense]|uniref:Transcription factor E2FA-like n=3 Tax=Gossypium TaxID=3633 RepID=A0ABM3B297_GOSHI|nr:transcription factor E2FA-like [Gossypium hirsutum]KAB1671025.1 hypothetical protein [Gossypium barbadense]PPD67470.1 hypothetical protein GOBAR_DD35657 [Gossypium barbadense]TYG48080.1 hypothetical protein ES288_D11G394700v1 [Gossypium darwinii]
MSELKPSLSLSSYFPIAIIPSLSPHDIINLHVRHGLTLPYQPPPTASAVPDSTVPPVVLPISRHLAFDSTKPPFVHPNDYNRFSSSNSRGIAADQEVEAIVVRSPGCSEMRGM